MINFSGIYKLKRCIVSLLGKRRIFNFVFEWKGIKRVHDHMRIRELGDKYTNVYIDLKNVHGSKEMSREQDKQIWPIVPGWDDASRRIHKLWCRGEVWKCWCASLATLGLMFANSFRLGIPLPLFLLHSSSRSCHRHRRGYIASSSRRNRGSSSAGWPGPRHR